MLSRVAAAVKAPRTHNRRRVTGSSGRRREGRESEPQRPNMSRRVFASAVLLFLVVMMCCGNGVAQGDGPPLSQEPVPKSPFGWRDKTGDETVSSLRVPSLVEVDDGQVFAVAEAQCTKGGSGFTGIVSELLTLTDDKPKEELDKSNLKTQVPEGCIFEGGKCPADKEEKCACRTAGQAVSQSKTKVHVSRPTTVVKGSDIYMLAGNYSWAYAENDLAVDWGLMLVKGHVSGENKKGKRIYWNDTYAIPWTYKGNQHSILKRLIGGGGSGVKMDDGTLVFPLEGTTKEADTEEGGKPVSLIISSSDNINWKLSKGMSDGGCSVPSVVEWKDKKLIMMTACDDGRRRVYESGDKEDSWTEALGTLSRVWGNKQGEGGVRSGFITATIDAVDNDNRNVMLLTLPVYSEENVEKGELHLWLTDNTHIVDIGPVSGDDDAAASSLLYKSAGSGDKKDELIALYEKKKDGEKPSPGMVSVLLTEQLQRVKEVLAKWKEVDERVSKLCPSKSDVGSKSAGNACSTTDKITDGLVGFLSGDFSDNTWRDEYLGVNATVKNNDEGGKKATLHEGSVKLQGAWAEWPVGSQGENQLYHFANYNFTLVATVSIHEVPEEGNSIPLMGVRLDGGEKGLMELSYDSEKKWRVLCSDGTTKKLKSTWDPETQYQVAIVLRNGTQGSAYVDGQRVCGNVQRELETTKSKAISHFYIGGDGGSAEGQEDVSVTVTNVLLYNRPFSFSGENADVEEDADSSSEDPESVEANSPSVEGEQIVDLPATKPSEAPEEQAALRRPRKESEAQQITTEGKPATTQQVPTASNSHAVGGAAGDAGNVYRSGLLPLLLLGLWGFTAL
ncbi:putative trans-sialidase, Group V [Trypanosoma cruzi]|nr:putative trans-sialidase, Group V [Trypanosoma cruzi]